MAQAKEIETFIEALQAMGDSKDTRLTLIQILDRPSEQREELLKKLKEKIVDHDAPLEIIKTLDLLQDEAVATEALDYLKEQEEFSLLKFLKNLLHIGD